MAIYNSKKMAKRINNLWKLFQNFAKFQLNRYKIDHHFKLCTKWQIFYKSTHTGQNRPVSVILFSAIQLMQANVFEVLIIEINRDALVMEVNTVSQTPPGPLRQFYSKLSYFITTSHFDHLIVGSCRDIQQLIIHN